MREREKKSFTTIGLHGVLLLHIIIIIIIESFTGCIGNSAGLTLGFLSSLSFGAPAFPWLGNFFWLTSVRSKWIYFYTQGDFAFLVFGLLLRDYM